ncbi:hypothetical protein Nepgr_031743 [Nepenthes gracilis]|uniref:Uncharacterized protein n=1 Tax=Nepenthes gracilis TaxID=150966 RepID=A0AAD3THB2_NEPGR|nr:hypothetical protein Nepgr_031743 [Nepenthes gracilis]
MFHRGESQDHDPGISGSWAPAFQRGKKNPKQPQLGITSSTQKREHSHQTTAQSKAVEPVWAEIETPALPFLIRWLLLAQIPLFCPGASGRSWIWELPGSSLESGALELIWGFFGGFYLLLVDLFLNKLYKNVLGGDCCFGGFSWLLSCSDAVWLSYCWVQGLQLPRAGALES